MSMICHFIDIFEEGAMWWTRDAWGEQSGFALRASAGQPSPVEWVRWRASRRPLSQVGERSLAV